MVVLVDTDGFADLFSHIVDLVIILLSISSEESESLFEHFEILTVASAFCPCLRVVLIDTGDFLLDISAYILDFVIILSISSDDSESLDKHFELLTVVSDFCSCLRVVLIDIGDFLVDTSAHILDLVIILSVSSDDSESLDKHFELLTVVSAFCPCLRVVLIDTGDFSIDTSAHILDLVIILSISSEDSESLDEHFKVRTVLLLKDLVTSLTLSFEDEDFIEELFCISL